MARHTMAIQMVATGTVTTDNVGSHRLTKHRLVVLLSGRGSNLSAFIDAIESGQLNASVPLVVSNRADAEGLVLARAASIETLTLSHHDYPSRELFDDALAEVVASASPDLVILAGFMRILTPVFVERFEGRLMNIHPSLLPKYPGLRTHQRALDNQDRTAGATVHYVTAQLDGGPPVLFAELTISDSDTADTLAARILPLEHVIFPMAAGLHLSGRLRQHEGKAWLDNAPVPATGFNWQHISVSEINVSSQ